MKKILLVLIVGAVITLVGCQKKSSQNIVTPVPTSVIETGTVIDVSDKNGQTITTVPGDVIYIKLVGEAASGNQWSVTSTSSSNMVSLKDHKLVGLMDKNAPNKQFIDEWWIKVERTGVFDLRYEYGRPGTASKKTFAVSIISQ